MRSMSSPSTSRPVDRAMCRTSQVQIPKDTDARTTHDSRFRPNVRPHVDRQHRREGNVRARLTSIILPCAMLTPRLAHPDSATASSLPSEPSTARILRRSSATSQPISRAAGSTPRLSADAFGSPTPASIACSMPMADATCRSKRLNRALTLLISPASQGKHPIDLTVDLQFGSDSSFVPAFRQQFGLTPGEIRKLEGLDPRNRSGAGTRQSALQNWPDAERLQGASG